jgi:Tfp pilus assembly protein PilO
MMMIDWDELLEDVDWTKWISIIVGGIIAIVAMVLVGLDFSRANNLKTLLQSDLDRFNDFDRTVAVPNEKDMENLRNKKAEFEAKLAKDFPSRLPVAFNQDDVKALIEKTAGANGIEINNISLGSDSADGYCLIYPMEVDFTGSAGKVIDFLSRVQGLTTPHKVLSKPLRPGGVMTLTVEFYYFDQNGFDQNYNCNTKISVPEIPTRDVNLDTIYLFKGRVAAVKSEVDRKWAGLVSTKQKFEDFCKLDIEAERLSQEYNILASKTK